ncbi:MAG: Methyltransferase [Candidatus Jettenia ecosi]|uniref:Methyltransferase n=1 Tax=Candidatus Jettenia ecosi TaxID=2494326 RepID=A0A533Q8X7_9BACT|nr:MAG: Methyltransferase [Candidatus Jettenia ecosi]
MSHNTTEEIKIRRYRLPDHLSWFIEQQLDKIGFSLATPKSLAQTILRQSDFYIRHPYGKTPWKEHWAQAAQLAYYFPLNWIRAQAILNRGEEVGFWNDLKSYLEFGSGLGPFTCQNRYFNEGLCIEPSLEAQSVARNLTHHFGIIRTLTWNVRFEKTEPIDVAIFSYVLTELPQLPPWIYEVKNLVFVEPSTQDDGRRLMNLRERLIKDGYYPYAPCVHSNACPLLIESKKDWCHDRVLFDAPPWWLEMEEYLPMKNRTITFSYLLMKKEKPDMKKANMGRLVGDSLIEKGKTRQMVCRNSRREFLSWLHKEADKFELPRGEMVSIPEDEIRKGPEIRIRKSPKLGLS